MRASGYQQPFDWKRTRARIIKRDQGICHVCRRPGATSVDHVIPVHLHGGHEDTNLRAIHPVPCHAEKTEAERRAALADRPSRRRAPRRHPNLLA